LSGLRTKQIKKYARKIKRKGLKTSQEPMQGQLGRLEETEPAVAIIFTKGRRLRSQRGGKEKHVDGKTRKRGVF